MMVDKKYYNKIFAQAFSPCGKFLFVGDRYGEISRFNIANLLTTTDTQIAEKCKSKPDKFQFLSEDIQITAFVTTEESLICGTHHGEIYGISWSSLLTPKLTPCIQWTIQLPKMTCIFVRNGVNCLWFDADTNLLYVGCGDYSINVYELQSVQLVRTLESHKNYIHDIHSQGNNQLVSGGEDGSVCLWDLRSHELNCKLYPFKNKKIGRSRLGKWIGAVALNDYWMLCGGGPRTSLWHLYSMAVTTIYPTEDNGIHVCEFYKDRVMIGGTSPQLHQFNYSGDICAQIPISACTAYTVIQREEPYKVLCIAGSSRHIDLCTNFSYRDQILRV